MLKTDKPQPGPRLIDFTAYREWLKYPKDTRQIYLNNAYCPRCHMTAFARNYNIRKDFFGLVIEGYCKKCGHSIMRTLD